eukprot:scaffold19_cov114-Cylindrotheca_fusiformis.AAC.3
MRSTPFLSKWQDRIPAQQQAIVQCGSAAAYPRYVTVASRKQLSRAYFFMNWLHQPPIVKLVSKPFDE